MRPKIIAHRGASFDAPENTIAAFELGFEQNSDGIEGDFHLSSDNIIICMHDGTSKRTADKDITIKESSLEEIKKLDAGSWKDEKWTGERVPTLKETLNVLSGDKVIYIEIKSEPSIVPCLKEVIEDSNLNPENINIISFNAEAIRDFKKAMPEFKAFWLTGFKQNEETGCLHPSPQELLNKLIEINADGVDCNAHECVNEEYVSVLRDAGMELHVWTIDNIETAKRFQKLGFDSITTNKPALLINNL